MDFSVIRIISSSVIRSAYVPYGCEPSVWLDIKICRGRTQAFLYVKVNRRVDTVKLSYIFRWAVWTLYHGIGGLVHSGIPEWGVARHYVADPPLRIYAGTRGGLLVIFITFSIHICVYDYCAAAFHFFLASCFFSCVFFSSLYLTKQTMRTLVLSCHLWEWNKSCKFRTLTQLAVLVFLTSRFIVKSQVGRSRIIRRAVRIHWHLAVRCDVFGRYQIVRVRLSKHFLWCGYRCVKAAMEASAEIKPWHAGVCAWIWLANRSPCGSVRIPPSFTTPFAKYRRRVQVF